MLNDFMEMKKGVNACRDNDGSEKPGHDRTPLFRRRIEFHRHSEKSGDRFPPFVWWRAVEIATTRLLGKLLNSRQRDGFARFLRQWGWRRLGRWAHLQRLRFAGVEPDKFANFTDFDFDSTGAIKYDFDHWVTAGRTRPGAAAFVMDRMEPERIDRFGSK